jgi:Tfp pilus assembly protein PilF
MDETVNLFEHLLAAARRFQQLGRPGDARAALERLASFPDLPDHLAEETQVRLAELALRRRRYKLARQHLRAALRHRPDSARSHFMLATAYRANEEGNLSRAAHHYRRSLELNPEQPRCLSDYGLLCLRLGEVEEGLEHLRKAVALSRDNADSLGKLVSGLCRSGQADEARSTLREGLFRNPRSPRFQKLWVDFQLLQLRRQQEIERLRHPVEEGPVLLPFVRLPDEKEGSDKRRDDPTSLPGPHRARIFRRAQRREVR